MSEVIVAIDDRARLVTAVLAASKWPEQEQAQLTHAVHPHAKQTRYHLREFGEHAAVVGVNKGLASGAPVADYFTAALRCTWPSFEVQDPLPTSLADGAWVAALAKFGQETAVYSTFWPAHQAAWQEAQTDLSKIFGNSRMRSFFGRLCGQPINQTLAIMPNIVYPALSAVVAQTQETVYLLVPPPKAVGESPPWPYGEDPGWVIAESSLALVGYWLAPTLPQFTETQQNLLKHAATTLLLEQELDEAESMAYLVRSKKQHKLPQLPGVVENLRDALQAESVDLSTILS